jgi:hypothetical protein
MVAAKAKMEAYLRESIFLIRLNGRKNTILIPKVLIARDVKEPFPMKESLSKNNDKIPVSLPARQSPARTA